ncbi:ABC transporter permease [Nitrospirillum amazonense]|uniref:ABC transporter permease n=1 Tax=Nitrospirillum amazonense TaxID=28077 RepID=UPI002DD44338|nr:ABC transporter permease [Nitrospirillum amazonense]MEC4593825.1 ABC transporter permease [Nitrospirillum amazonense]
MTPSREGARIALAVGAALALGFAVMACVSDQPWAAFRALLTGPLPSIERAADGRVVVHRLVRFGAWLQDATTLTLVGLAIAIPFRARQFSLGADGQLFMGALAAAAVSLGLGDTPTAMPLAFLAAAATGAGWGLVAGLLKTRFEANEIVTTLMLNVVAVQVYRLVVGRVLNDPTAGFITTPPLPEAATLAPLIARTTVTAMVLVAPAAVAAALFLLRRTTLGYEIDLAGANPWFAVRAGVPVARATALAFALGGVFAGLAGFHVSNALLKRLPIDLTPGIGLEGIVVALLARGRVGALPLAALGYAYLRVGAQAMERATDVPREVVLVIQALIILFVVSDRLAPLALGLMRRVRTSIGGRPA